MREKDITSEVDQLPRKSERLTTHGMWTAVNLKTDRAVSLPSSNHPHGHYRSPILHPDDVDLSSVMEAHALVESGSAGGKVVVSVSR